MLNLKYRQMLFHLPFGLSASCSQWLSSPEPKETDPRDANSVLASALREAKRMHNDCD